MAWTTGTQKSNRYPLHTGVHQMRGFVRPQEMLIGGFKVGCCSGMICTLGSIVAVHVILVCQLHDRVHQLKCFRGTNYLLSTSTVCGQN